MKVFSPEAKYIMTILITVTIQQ